MRSRPIRFTGPILLTLLAAGPASRPADPMPAYRERFAIAGRLDVTALKIDDTSAGDGPVEVEMICRPTSPGTFRFRFDAYDPAGEPKTVTLAWPPPSSPRLSAVRPGGIHGGPPRVGPSANQPSVHVLVDHPDQIVVRWTYADSAGNPSQSGYKLAHCEFTAPTTRP